MRGRAAPPHPGIYRVPPPRVTIQKRLMSHMTFTSIATERLALATNTSAIRSACIQGGRYTRIIEAK